MTSAHLATVCRRHLARWGRKATVVPHTHTYTRVEYTRVYSRTQERKYSLEF